MEKGIMSFAAAEGLNIAANSFDELISHIEHSDDFWLIKGNDLTFAYMNQIAKYYCDLPENYDVEGRLIGEMPVIYAEHQDVIHTFEDMVKAASKLSTCMANTKYGGKNKYVQPFMGTTSPLFKDDKIFGIITRCRKLDFFTPDHFINNRPPDTIQFGNPSELFTDREFEVVFYTLQRLSAKEIARRTGITPRGVETHLHNIYMKAGIDNRNQLITLCRDKGYDRYVPEKFLDTVPFKALG